MPSFRDTAVLGSRPVPPFHSRQHPLNQVCWITSYHLRVWNINIKSWSRQNISKISHICYQIDRVNSLVCKTNHYTRPQCIVRKYFSVQHRTDQDWALQNRQRNELLCGNDVVRSTANSSVIQKLQQCTPLMQHQLDTALSLRSFIKYSSHWKMFQNKTCSLWRDLRILHDMAIYFAPQTVI